MSSLNKTFSALSDPTRRAILSKLMQGEASLSEIAAPFKMSQTGVTRHVTALKEAGLVKVRKRGRTRYCELQANPMKAASEWLTDYQKFWDKNLNNLGAYLGED